MPHGGDEDADLVGSPFNRPHRRGRAPASRTRRCAGASTQARTSAISRSLEEFFAAGATDYAAYLFVYGDRSQGRLGDRSQGTGIVYSFATDRGAGSADDDVALLQATLPALSLAMKAHAGHVIASGLLRTYLGEDAGRRVHAGAVMRGSIEACAPRSCSPTSAASRRSATLGPGAASSTCSTTSSRRWPRRCASAAARC